MVAAGHGARVLVGALVLTVGATMAIAIAISRRQPLRDVVRQEGDRLVVAAKALAVVIILLALAVLVVVNN
jgi:hypothetical protein